MNSELDKLFESKTKKDTFVINFMSFGYKHGMPTEADWVIDVRFIPNPYYVSSLKRPDGQRQEGGPVRDETGRHKGVCQQDTGDHNQIGAVLRERGKIQPHRGFRMYGRTAPLCNFGQ